MPNAFFHALGYFAGIDPAQTQTTTSERNYISKYAQGCKRAVEIGVFEGVTTAVIASALTRDGLLFAIDPFSKGRVGICWSKPIAKREAYRMRPSCTIKFVQLYSHQAAATISGKFDFIFIDGDHSWDGIVQDWHDWSGRVQAGGIIALHDTLVPTHNPRVANLGSHKYYVEHIQHDSRFEVVEQVDSLSILRCCSP